MRNEKYGVIVCVLITLTLVIPSSSVFAGVKQDKSNQIPKAFINSIIGTSEKNGNQRLYSFEFTGYDNDGYIKEMIWYLDGEKTGSKFCSSRYVTWDVMVYVDGDPDGEEHVIKLVVVDDEDAKGFSVKSFTVTITDDADSEVPEEGSKDSNSGSNDDDSVDVDYEGVTLTLLSDSDKFFVGDRISVQVVMDEETGDDSYVGATAEDDTDDIGSYDFKFVFNWGDSGTDSVVLSDDPMVDASHVYRSSGVYTVTVYGYYKNVFVGSSSVTVFVYDREEVPLDGDDGVKIYGDHMFAQSFRPWFENLTFVNISMGCVTNSMGNSGSVSTSSDDDHVGLLMHVRKLFFDDSGFIGLIMRIINMFLGRTTGSNSGSSSQGSNPLGGKLGDLTISIRNDLYGEDLVSKSFTPNEVKNCGGKLVWKLDKEYTLVHGIDDPYWEEHGLEPKNEDYNSKTFYIVVRTNGGDKHENYYTWKYGDNYNSGMAWEWVESANEWRSDTYNVLDKDFDFELDGCLAWEKTSGDGIVKQYNIVDFWNLNEKKVVPFLRGTSFTFVYENNSNEDNLKAIDEIDRLSDGDDVILLWLTGDGSPYEPMINGLSATRIEKHFERIPTPTGGICMIFDCCYAGQFTDPSKSAVCKPGRVIMASCADWDYAGTLTVDNELWWSFTYYLYQGLQEGYKTAEELFNYASTKNYGHDEQIYDTYPGELQIAK